MTTHTRRCSAKHMKTNIRTMVSPFFSFQVNEKGKTRIVRQFHFTAWPDRGVPKFASSMVHFRSKIKNTRTEGKGPTLVHCRYLHQLISANTHTHTHTHTHTPTHTHTHKLAIYKITMHIAYLVRKVVQYLSIYLSTNRSIRLTILSSLPNLSIYLSI